MRTSRSRYEVDPHLELLIRSSQRVSTAAPAATIFLGYNPVMSWILVTGANGFVGRALCQRLIADGHSVIAAIRSTEPICSVQGLAETFTKSLDSATDWSDALSEVEVVVHLAARVHVMRESAADPISEFRRINTEATQHLAHSALACGVKRFVFLSTIGVNGNVTAPGQRFSEQDPPAPHNAYSRSKFEAEELLCGITSGSPMKLAILRAPLVYGPGNPGNAHKLFQAVYKRWPLPLSSVNNRRSLIYLGNLVDAITLCCFHPRAAGETYLVSDSEDVSTPELMRRIASAFGVPSRLFPLSPALLSVGATLLGKRSMADRLINSLAIDSSKIVHDLGWNPPFTMQEGLAATAQWFLKQKRRT